MEQMLQNEPTELSVQAVPQKAVEQACFHALTLISRNCEYLDQHLARTGADQESRQAVTDISAASAQIQRGTSGNQIPMYTATAVISATQVTSHRNQ